MTATAKVNLWLESEYEIYKNTVWFVKEEEPDEEKMKAYVEDIVLYDIQSLMAKEFIECFLEEVDWNEVIENFKGDECPF